MYPSCEQVQVAAYHRWKRRGADHGADLDDWMAAEQGLLFALNYRVVASHRLVASVPTMPTAGGRRICRFCEQTSPQAAFTDPIHAIPQFLCNHSLLAENECDECHAQFKESLEPDFEWFSRPYRTGRASINGLTGPDAPRHSLSIASLKCLARMALSIMPDDELDAFHDTIEWVANPDHDLDGRSFRGLGCFLHVEPEPRRTPYVTLARRLRDEVPVPYMLFFLGTANVTFEIPVPLCVKDDDLDGEGLLVPRVGLPDAERIWDDSSVCVFIPVASAEAGLAVESGVA